MNFMAFISGMVVLMFSVVFYYMKDNFVAQAVSDSTTTVLQLVFPAMLIFGVILVIIGFTGN